MNKQQKRSLAIVFFTVFLDLVGFGIILPLIPYLAKTYEASAFEVGWLMAIFSLMQFLFSPFWGRLSDRIGRRPVMLISISGVMISYFGFAFSQTLAVLFVARAAAGFFAANISTAQAIIADMTPKDGRSVGMGLIGAAFGLGFILGPALAGLTGPIGESLGTVPPFGMQFSSLVAAGLSFVNLVFAFFYLPETKAPGASSKSSRNLSQGLRFVFGHSQLRPLILIFFLMSTSMALMEVMLFLFVKERFLWDYKTASFAFTYVGVIMVLTQGYFIRKWIPKYGEKKLLFAGVLFMGVSFVGIAFSYSIWSLAVVMTILAVGNGCMRPPVMGISSVLTKENEQGFVMGLMQSMAAVGRIVGPLAGGFLYSEWAQEAPFLASGLLSFVALSILMFHYVKLPDPQAK